MDTVTSHIVSQRVIPLKCLRPGVYDVINSHVIKIFCHFLFYLNMIRLLTYQY